MKKNTCATTKKYPVKIYFELGEDAWPYPLDLTDDQVRTLWNEIEGEAIPADVEVNEVIQTAKDWEAVAAAAAERLFHYILDNKKLNKLMDEACK